jgi:tetratricopeptide (TPR) repeat protein
MSIRTKSEPGLRILAAVLALAAGVSISGCGSSALLQMDPVTAPTNPFLEFPLAKRADNDSDRERITEFEQKQDWAGLLRTAEGLLKRQSERSDWWVIAGYAWLQSGDYPKAIDALSRATARSPEDIDAWNLLGETQRLMKQPGRATQTLERAATISRTSHITFFLLGEAYRDAGKLDRASGAYQESLRIEPEFSFAWFQLGVLYARTGEREKADAVLKQLQKLNPPLAEQLAARIRSRAR